LNTHLGIDKRRPINGSLGRSKKLKRMPSYSSAPEIAQFKLRTSRALKSLVAIRWSTSRSINGSQMFFEK
jgi:hypothetical protein